MQRPGGRLAFVLHAHLPYVVGHGVWPHGEDWLNEAAAETYIPLLMSLERLAAEDRRDLLGMDFSPVLCEQLSDPAWRTRFSDYCATREASARTDELHFSRQGRAEHVFTARMWGEFYWGVRRRFHELGGDVLSGYRALQQRGVIEIFTCAASHAYLPLLSRDGSIRAQVTLAARSHSRHFGGAPAGMWLPECAYRPAVSTAGAAPGAVRGRAGLEEFLAAEGLRYFVVDSHMVDPAATPRFYGDRFASAGAAGYRPAWAETRSASGGTYRLAAPGEPLAGRVSFFVRDDRTGRQVWSGEHGYPGEASYLEFHKKHDPGGLRYWRVTDSRLDLGSKQPYDAAAAAASVAGHARHFLGLVASRSGPDSGGPPVCAAYDAELFGHWWFEGVAWLEAVLRETSARDGLRCTTPSRELERHPPASSRRLPEGSWGEGGSHAVWDNPRTEWIWRQVHAAEARMASIASAAVASPLTSAREASALAARQLLLLQASDWPFLISTGSATEYSIRRVEGHARDFTAAADAAEGCLSRFGPGDELMSRAAGAAGRARVFPDLDLAWWADAPLGVHA